MRTIGEDLYTKPFPRSYWVVPGKVCAGAYPGDPDEKAMEGKLKGLIDCGIRHVVNLMEPTELDHDGRPFEDYREMLKVLGMRTGARMTVSSFPIRDVSVPSRGLMKSILDDIDHSLLGPSRVHPLLGRKGQDRHRGGLLSCPPWDCGGQACPCNDCAASGGRPQDIRALAGNSRAEGDGFIVEGRRMKMELIERYQGCLLGLAVGDALGATLEFKPRESFEPIDDMIGGGCFELEPGQWTDDTSLALCLAESLIEKKGFDAYDQMKKYLLWYRTGYLSSIGYAFDIGGTTAIALRRFEKTEDPFSGPTDNRS